MIGGLCAGKIVPQGSWKANLSWLAVGFGCSCIAGRMLPQDWFKKEL
jgi:hypothetical protein